MNARVNVWSMPASRLSLISAIWFALAGCKGEERAPAPGRPPPPEKPPSISADAAPVADRVSDADRQAAQTLLTAWLAAQGGGDFAGYQKLYGDPFAGVRRSGKKVRRFDRAGWMEDRARMFKKPMTITADGIQVVAHRDQIHLFFTQTFEQGTYK